MVSPSYRASSAVQLDPVAVYIPALGCKSLRLVQQVKFLTVKLDACSSGVIPKSNGAHAFLQSYLGTSSGPKIPELDIRRLTPGAGLGGCELRQIWATGLAHSEAGAITKTPTSYNDPTWRSPE